MRETREAGSVKDRGLVLKCPETGRVSDGPTIPAYLIVQKTESIQARLPQVAVPR